MAEYAKSSRTRVTEFTRRTPTEWRPQEVAHPKIKGWNYSDDSAWCLVAEILESEHEFQEVVLRQPMGEKAWACLVDVGEELSFVYIKVQMGRGNKVIGRSFHLSEHGREVRDSGLKVYRLRR